MRPSWGEYFLGLARAAAARGTCDRKQVGCVLVSVDREVIATGYNGSVRGQPHCDEVGHDLVDAVNDDGVLRPNCVRTVHAEVNALCSAARRGAAVLGATAYVTCLPCRACCYALLNAGVAAIVYGEGYRDDPRVRAACEKAGVTLHHIVTGDRSPVGQETP